jgi:adenosylcobinamide amidohydrolase
MLAGNFPKDASSMKILADKQWGEDAAIAMSVGHSDGQTRVNQFKFHKTPDGWQLMVPASVIEGYQEMLTSEPKPIE